MNEFIYNLFFFPFVSLSINNGCRMNCRFCCAENMKNNESIDKKTILKMIDILHKNKVKRILYTGGEPLLSPFLKDYIIKSYNYNIENTIMTSDGKMIEKLDIDPIYISKFWISIHGLEECHDYITGKKVHLKI